MNKLIQSHRIMIIFLLLVISASTSLFSYAYWSNNIASPTNSNVVGNTGVGSWTQCNLIYTAQEFYDFATSSNSQSSDFYCLANDIDFTGFNWDYNDSHTGNIFRGTFDGRGHTLSNIRITPTSTNLSYLSIFNRLDGATIKNVTINDFGFNMTNAFFTTVNIQAGVLAGNVNGNPVLIENIRINGADVVANTVQGAGGLTGQIEANTNVTIRNIKIRDLTVLSSSKRIGGLVSRVMKGTGTIIVQDIDIKANLAANNVTTYTGGLFGTVQGVNFQVDRVMVEYTAQGSIQLQDTTLNYTSKKYTGGLVGNNNADSVMVINDAFFTGNLYNNYTYAGAMLGRRKADIIVNEGYYSNVYFVNTYVAPTTTNTVHGQMVNEQSMPSLAWWNQFSDDFYAANSLWAQDGTGRLYIID